VTFLQLAPYFIFRRGNCLSHVGTQGNRFYLWDLDPDPGELEAWSVASATSQ